MNKESLLEELLNIQSGYAFKSKLYGESGHFLVRIRNVQDGFLCLDKPKYVVLDDKTKRFALDEGDLLTSLTGNIGRVARVEKAHLPAALNQRVARLTVIDPSTLSADYLYHFLSSDLFKNELAATGHGAAQQNVSPAAIGKLIIPLPPLPEQKRIVAILDEAFAGISKAVANAEKNLANAHELLESYLCSVFIRKGEGWKLKILGEACDLFQGLAINKGTKHLLVDHSSLPLLRIKDLRNGTQEQFVCEEGYPPNALVAEDDILYTRTGQIGLVFRGRRGVLHNNCFKIVPREGLRRTFLFWWLQNRDFKREIVRLASRAAQPDITHKIFKAQPILIPPLSTQVSIAESIEKLYSKTRHLESIYQQKLSALAELKQSILQKAFTGELKKDTVKKQLAN
ncbi:MAG: hypothetical protein HF981_07415 [Desulfobacteraceae bacterium]|nr:hypothetical protein [Desulfobacteraceae bacterium]MBC2750197.1 restriction endonuclease subunit S [Desulfobacteraceae bacterium]